MAYQTIRDLIGHIKSVHRSLRNGIQDALPHAEDDRAAMLLGVIDEHEAALERAIQAVEQRGDGAVLDTWLQFEPNVEIQRVLRRVEPDESTSSEELAARVLETENTIIRLYELLQGSSGSSSVQSFFSSLLALADSAVRRSARSQIESRDL